MLFKTVVFNSEKFLSFDPFLCRSASESRSSRRLARRGQTEVAALRAHMEELETARASAPTAPDQTIRKAVTVLFGLLVEQVGRGGAAVLLHDNLNNRERAALAGVVTDTSFRILLRLLFQIKIKAPARNERPGQRHVERAINIQAQRVSGVNGRASRPLTVWRALRPALDVFGYQSGY